MIRSQIAHRILKAGAVSLAGSMVIATSPVFANTTAADVVEPIRQEQAETLISGDNRFRQLFASWEALDDAGPDGSTLSASVSIPSRMPLEGSNLTSSYGMRTHPVLGGRRRHKGVDLAAPKGTPIFATADGIVGRAEWFSSYGLYVEIAHGANLETRYAHMSRLAVAPGERVRKGEIIGYVGSTGRSTGPHLHYEVRIDGIAVNPIPYMVETDAQLRLVRAETQSGKGGE